MWVVGLHMTKGEAIVGLFQLLMRDLHLVDEVRKAFCALCFTRVRTHRGTTAQDLVREHIVHLHQAFRKVHHTAGEVERFLNYRIPLSRSIPIGNARLR